MFWVVSITSSSFGHTRLGSLVPFQPCLSHIHFFPWTMTDVCSLPHNRCLFLLELALAVNLPFTLVMSWSRVSRDGWLYRTILRLILSYHPPSPSPLMFSHFVSYKNINFLISDWSALSFSISRTRVSPSFECFLSREIWIGFHFFWNFNEFGGGHPPIAFPLPHCFSSYIGGLRAHLGLADSSICLCRVTLRSNVYAPMFMPQRLHSTSPFPLRSPRCVRIKQTALSSVTNAKTCLRAR